MYKIMYLTLFNAITKVLEKNSIDEIKALLIQAQMAAEEICINSNEDI